MLGVFQDLRHGLRALTSRPGLTIAAALSLGLAIGAQTSVYCLIDTLMQVTFYDQTDFKECGITLV